MTGHVTVVLTRAQARALVAAGVYLGAALEDPVERRQLDVSPSSAAALDRAVRIVIRSATDQGVDLL
jgi:hypothetical protein